MGSTILTSYNQRKNFCFGHSPKDRILKACNTHRRHAWRTETSPQDPCWQDHHLGYPTGFPNHQIAHATTETTGKTVGEATYLEFSLQQVIVEVVRAPFVIQVVLPQGEFDDGGKEQEVALTLILRPNFIAL